MPIVNCIGLTESCWLFYSVYETLTVIVSNMYLLYVSFASLGLGLSTAGLHYKTAAVLWSS